MLRGFALYREGEWGSVVQSAASMTPQQFMLKWGGVSLSERSAAQQHFVDLCHLLGQPTPAEADSHGAWFTFEKGTSKTGGGEGFADVWMRDHFAWEYKRPGADLTAAYKQLLLYSENLENPPLLVVCDIQRYQVHTHFTGTKKLIHEFTNDDLDEPEILGILRALFTNPEALKPEVTTRAVTETAAGQFASLSGRLAARGVEPERIARFLTRLLFCFFSEDTGLLPRHLFRQILALASRRPPIFASQVGALFETMRDGGVFALQEIAHFNGDLFGDADVIDLTAEEIEILRVAADLDWSAIEPAIFGTLFERGLDPAKRAQLGAHYTSREDILLIVEPVVMEPLRREWDAVRAKANEAVAAWWAAKDQTQRTRRRNDLARLLLGFQERLSGVTILDPACGSGNFLYVSLALLKDLEKEVITYAAHNGLGYLLPQVSPRQLHGIEINPYARDLAQIVVWIGYLQWITANGFPPKLDPVLDPLDTILLMDAIVDHSDPAQPREPQWPAAEFIVGNPPFLGAKRLRAELGDSYVDILFRLYGDRLPNFSDLVCYFFEKARAQVAATRAKRVGLLATNSIRGGGSRVVLERIKGTGDIFMAWADRSWILDGAAVRVSMVGFDDGSEPSRTLDGLPVGQVNADLTGAVDLTRAKVLPENRRIVYLGVQLSGPFDVSEDVAKGMLTLPVNPNGRPNSDVIKPLVNGMDLIRRPRHRWIIDFGVDTTQEDAALYEAPFEHLREHVKPMRASSRSSLRDARWWLTLWPRPALRQELRPLRRYLATPTIAKHRLFVWLPSNVLPNHQVVVFARDDDYFFGVLHSRAHEMWSLRMGTSLEDRPRYTPTTCFETFPFPRPDDAQREAIAAAARELNARREAWLNPPGAAEADLKTRTLTNLYNARPTWLAQAHERLDRAVFAAYGWDDTDPAVVDEDTVLTRLLALNLERAGRSPA